MNQTARIAAGIVATLAITGAGYQLAFKPLYLAPRTALRSDIEDGRAYVRQVDEHLHGQPDGGRAALNAELDGYIDRTLGDSLEIVDHALRSRLNRIGEGVGLAGLTVSTGRTAALASPARQRYRNSGADRALRERVDFVEVEGSVGGEGTFEQALRLLHTIQREPWLKRIYSVRLDPRDNGARFTMTVRLVTLYVPGRAPHPDADLSAGVEDVPPFEAFTQLAAANPFHVPPPPAPPPRDEDPAPDTPDPPKPPPFPYQDWRLTGIVDGPLGVEVWLVNRNSGESRRLVIGDKVHEVVLLDAEGDEAEFARESSHFRIVVGQSLRDGLAQARRQPPVDT